jgi:hypothetical protein
MKPVPFVQVVHLLLEKGQSPASKDVPVAPRCALPDQDAQGQAPEKAVKKPCARDYSFVTEGQILPDYHVSVKLFIVYSKYDLHV